MEEKTIILKLFLGLMSFLYDIIKELQSIRFY